MFLIWIRAFNLVFRHTKMSLWSLLAWLFLEVICAGKQSSPLVIRSEAKWKLSLFFWYQEKALCFYYSKWQSNTWWTRTAGYTYFEHAILKIVMILGNKMSYFWSFGFLFCFHVILHSLPLLLKLFLFCYYCKTWNDLSKHMWKWR